MDCLDSEDLKEEKDGTAPVRIVDHFRILRVPLPKFAHLTTTRTRCSAIPNRGAHGAGRGPRGAAPSRIRTTGILPRGQ
jgi:hypothetical protein